MMIFFTFMFRIISEKEDGGLAYTVVLNLGYSNCYHQVNIAFVVKIVVPSRSWPLNHCILGPLKFAADTSVILTS